MLGWLSENIATVAVSAVLLAIVGLVIFKMIKDRKKGVGGCGCGCGGCAMSEYCHKKGDNKNV